jgi:arylsulfatase A-like enzyme
MASDRQRPNILLITTDQQRYDTLGVTGNPYVRTPHLDALAARGVLFERGYIQNPVCIPSRACIQTGRYVHQHGVAYMEEEIATTPGLPPWETTFMERLQRAGYATAVFGKLHMLPPRGFDEMQLTMGKGARWAVAEGSPLGPAQLGPVYAGWLERKRPGAYEAIYAQRRRPEYRAQATAIVNVLAADEYVDYWIGENTWRYLDRDRPPDAPPFFAWCSFCGPHGPFDPPEPYASMYRQEDIPIPPLLHARQQHVPGEARRGRFDGPDGEALIRRIIAYYWAMVSFVDDMVGRIAEVLTRRGLWERTLVIVTTDHGEMLGDFGRSGKGNFAEQVIRAPYVVVPPGSRPRADGPRRIGSLVEHVDLAPTILDYAGLAQPAELPGISLRSILEDASGNPQPATRDAVLCEYVSNDRAQRSKCLRTARYKYVFQGAGRPAELYDLEADPQERVNVAGDPAYRAEAQRHAELLLDRLMRSEQTPWNSGQSRTAAPALDGFGLPVLLPVPPAR